MTAVNTVVAGASGAANTLSASLQTAARTLSSRSESPRLDAELLLCKVLALPRSALIVRGTEFISDDHGRAYEDLIARRLAGTPVAYLTGKREFWSLELDVTPDVLVPRPETEILVELALARLPENQMRSVLDLGTGSGAIALAIAIERPLVRMTGVDVCERALAVAMTNARKAVLDPSSARIHWRAGSWFDAVPDQRFDMIVANPPYIASNDPALTQLTAEPQLALCSGRTGLEALGEIVKGAAAHLNPNGWLILEHGNLQAEAVAGMLQRLNFSDIHSHADLTGNPRITLGSAPPPR